MGEAHTSARGSVASVVVMAHDVVVIGATVAGLTAARRLASEGFGVLVLDPSPAHVTASIGHGVAAVAHASTVANMRAAYGDVAVQEHLRRNVAGIEEIRKVAASAGLELEQRDLHDHSLGFALERELAELARLMSSGGGSVELLAHSRRRRAAAGLVSGALCVDMGAYAQALTAQARTAGAKIHHDVTVIRLQRGDGISKVAFRSNVDWTEAPTVATAQAVVDTISVSPWGRMARSAPPQVVPTLRLRPLVPEEVVTLMSGPPLWMIRPMGEEVLLLGVKSQPDTVERQAADLARWAEAELLPVEPWPDGERTGTLTIDPSDHGRPIVGASPIPGGYYVRGNGRGELMNGTASGAWLAAVLLGEDPAGKDAALPRFSRARAAVRGLLKR